MNEMRNLKEISKIWYHIYLGLVLLAIGFAINYVFKLNILGYQPIDTAFLYWLLACFMSSSFLIYPFRYKSPRDKIPIYDIVLFFLSLISCIYMSLNAINASMQGWSSMAPFIPTLLSVIIWGLVLETLRRTSGTAIFLIATFFSTYPIFARKMPGILKGMDYDFLTTARNHAMGLNSILGTPLQVVGTLLVGFMIFGVILNLTGGGQFFNDFALAILGKKRGGTAKVAVIGSALFGSLSGSAVSNVVTIGNIAIPSMKKTGYEPKYAAAIEACAATGGTIMPPIMGAAAFVMASTMGVSYATIVLAAVIPSVLYYYGLFIQIDAHAGKINIKPEDPDSMKPLKKVMKEGWYYVFVLVILLYFLMVLKIESYAPYFASLALMIFALIRKDLPISKVKQIIYKTGTTLIELVCVLAGVGLIVGALSITGTALAFSRELVLVVGDSMFLLLVAGALTSFVLGMGMTSVACYIFLSIVLVPALVTFGVVPMAAHFFVLYFGIISFITPPVALASIAASKIAGSDGMKTGFTSMQLGIVTYIVPFLFVYQPALLGQGDLLTIIYVFIKSAFAIYLLSFSLEGYVTRIEIKINLAYRVMFLIGSALVLLPNNIYSDIAGIIIAGLTFILLYRKKISEKNEKEVIAQ